MKACLEELLPVITAIVNTSLQNGEFPTALKEGRLIPSIKKSSLNPEEFSNFRPITNLTFLSKVVERIVVEQSRGYLLDNDLYPSLQSAYREFSSTETALLRVYNDLLRAIGQKNEVVLVLLDLSAAFDTIDHDILLNRLRARYGITGTVFRWFKVMRARNCAHPCCA